MRSLRKHAAWLGWVVAGVLALSAGGAALAQSNRSDERAAPAPDRGGRAWLGPRAFGGFAGKGDRGQVLHGEVTVETKDGRRTMVIARGRVTALTDTSITITSSDNVATTFTINDDTRFGFHNEPDPRAELRTGETATAIGTKSGDTNTATRVVTNREPRRR